MEKKKFIIFVLFNDINREGDDNDVTHQQPAPNYRVQPPSSRQLTPFFLPTLPKLRSFV